MKKVLNLAMYLIIASVLFVSCSEDNDTAPSVNVDGVYVLNEGSWGGTGSISTINLSDGITTNKAYKAANAGVPLGELPQAIAVSDKYVLITVTTGSGAGRLEIANKSDLKSVDYIENLSYPREVTIVDDMAYVSNGNGANAGDENDVLVIDLISFKIVKTIKVGAGPEKMILSGEKLFVANSGGNSNSDNTISVINTSTNEVIETITVRSCPKDMAVDANGDVWVYCAGVPDYTNWPIVTRTNFGISKIEVANSEVTNFDITDITAGGIKNITISKDKKTIYYISDAVYAMDYKANAVPTDKFINKAFYGIDVNPETNDIFCCETVAGDAGSIVIYNDKAEEIASYEVGVNPNSTFFSF